MNSEGLFRGHCGLVYRLAAAGLSSGRKEWVLVLKAPPVPCPFLFSAFPAFPDMLHCGSEVHVRTSVPCELGQFPSLELYILTCKMEWEYEAGLWPWAWLLCTVPDVDLLHSGRTQWLHVLPAASLLCWAWRASVLSIPPPVLQNVLSVVLRTPAASVGIWQAV